jgi:hypothetical protein
MSNVCNCPNPPGGKVTCSDNQLAMCGYKDGQVVGGCYDRPEAVASITERTEQNLALANWALSEILGISRSLEDSIEPDLVTMLRSGRFENEAGEILNFKVPRDLDLGLLQAASKPLLRTL